MKIKMVNLSMEPKVIGNFQNWKTNKLIHVLTSNLSS